MAGKIKSIHGIYKKHGREAFLEAAAYYSDHVNPNSIDKTIDEMESRWYDATTDRQKRKRWSRTTTTVNDHPKRSRPRLHRYRSGNGHVKGVPK